MKRSAFLTLVTLYSIAGVIAFFFTFAAVAKLCEMETFYGQLNSQPIPNSWTPLLVWLIPCSCL